MENTFSVKMIFHFYHSVVKAELKRRGFPKEVAKKIEEEHGLSLIHISEPTRP